MSWKRNKGRFQRPSFRYVKGSVAGVSPLDPQRAGLWQVEHEEERQRRETEEAEKARAAMEEALQKLQAEVCSRVSVH